MLQRRADLGQVFSVHAQPAHAGIDFEVNRMPKAKAGGSLFKLLNLASVPNSGRQAQPDNLILFAPPESGHKQDARLNVRITQGDCFIERGYAQPASAFFLQRPRTSCRAVAVTIRFDYRADCVLRTNVPLNDGEVVPQVLERHFSPGGPGRGTLYDFNSRHLADYSERAMRTSGYLGATSRRRLRSISKPQ